MISLILSILSFGIGVEVTPNVINPCDVYGKIFVVPDARLADFKVYVEETEAFSDVIVYKQSNSLFADKPGQWAFVSNKSFARVYIYFEKRRNMADFTIAYTDIESFAGCNR